MEINRITWFAKSYEDEFVKIVVSDHYKKAKMRQDKDRQKLMQQKSRSQDIDLLIQRVLEEKILGNLTEERYKVLVQSYEKEQLALKQQINHLQKIVDGDAKNELDVNSFLPLSKIIRRFLC